MPLVSVVVPAYNCSRYINETIASILAQKGEIDIEIIVINDGSTDNTGEMARSFGEPVKVIDQLNAGVCVARNRGLKEAKGEFIAFLDHDDYWFPNKLANQLAVFESHPEVDVVYSGLIWWRPNQKNGTFESPLVFKEQAEPQGIDCEFSGWIYHQMLLECCPLTSAALIRTKVVVDIGGFDESLPYSEDWDFFLKISRISQFIKLKEKTTLYRQHPTQGSRVTRPIDYRTRLLEDASKKWGLCSSDGRCITSKQFRRQLSKYCASFGVLHSLDGKGASRRIAAKALLKAWSIDRGNWKSLMYLIALAIGLKPNW